MAKNNLPYSLKIGVSDLFLPTFETKMTGIAQKCLKRHYTHSIKCSKQVKIVNYKL
jgi:hypothetical protein